MSTEVENNHNVLVTGANGFIGNALCRRMLAKGWYVRGAIRFLSPKTALPPGMDAVEIGSIGPSTEWETALEGIHTVVHLAARVHVMDDSTVDPIAAYRQINVDGTKHLAQIAASKKVQRFVYVSSIKVNGEGRADPYTEADQPAPVDPYGISKFEAERELHIIADKVGLAVVILRPPLFYGPEVKANFLQLLKVVDKGIPLPFGRVKNQRSLIFVENLIDAVIACIKHPNAGGKTYLISDGKDVSTPELIQSIAMALGRPSRVFPFPLTLLRLSAKIAGKSEPVSRLLDSLTVDCSKIRSELDWTPRFTMKEGLSQTAKWYRTEFGETS